jgi:hypothetical protein
MQLVSTGGLPQIKGIVSFVVAVFAVPVFDTIRVMTARILKGRSPFSADKTHLHHLFIDMGYSHAATTLIILCLDIAIVGVWFVTEKVAAISVDVQFYIVFVLGFVVDMAIYSGISLYRARRPERYALMQKRIAEVQIRRGKFLMKVQRMLDKL